MSLALLWQIPGVSLFQHIQLIFAFHCWRHIPIETLILLALTSNWSASRFHAQYDSN